MKEFALHRCWSAATHHISQTVILIALCVHGACLQQPAMGSSARLDAIRAGRHRFAQHALLQVLLPSPLMQPHLPPLITHFSHHGPYFLLCRGCRRRAQPRMPST